MRSFVKWFCCKRYGVRTKYGGLAEGASCVRLGMRVWCKEVSRKGLV